MYTHTHTHCSHNDLAYAIRGHFQNQFEHVDLTVNGSGMYGVDWQTDIPRLRAGKVGAQVSTGSPTLGFQDQFSNDIHLIILLLLGEQ